MRKINTIIVHCSATKEGQNFSASDIDKWHKERGFNSIGYHYIIKLDGTIEKGRDINEIGAHAKGYNTNSIGICYIGGLDSKCNPKDTRTNEQKDALISLISNCIYDIPEINKILGHRDTGANKACPCFDAIPEYEYLLK